MGNAGATMQRERHKSSDLSTPSSPANFRDSIATPAGAAAATTAVHAIVGGGGGGAQAFVFDKRASKTPSVDDEGQPLYYTKQTAAAAATSIESAAEPEFTGAVPRRRASTVSEGTVESVAAHKNNSSSMASTSSAAKGNSSNSESNASGVESGGIDTERFPSTALPTVLRWDGGGRNVMISGTFSKWKPIPMVRSHGNFVTIIDLPEGDHQYKFCVDGEWRHDPKLKSVENERGERNNLVSVRESDFEVFQALAKDSENVTNYAEKEYSQVVPTAKPWEKVTGPPVLPPHLLQVILNKDTPLSCEPTLLPEPNHVMLNHLYALSIKDGVMVLSATHRYRKKYVTTLLYKPI